MCRTVLQRSLWQMGGLSVSRVLHNRRPTALTNGIKAGRAILLETAKNYAHNAAVIGAGSGSEQGIDRRPVAIFSWSLAHVNHTLFHGEVTIGRRDEDVVVFQVLAIDRM